MHVYCQLSPPGGAPSSGSWWSDWRPRHARAEVAPVSGVYRSTPAIAVSDPSVSPVGRNVELLISNAFLLFLVCLNFLQNFRK